MNFESSKKHQGSIAYWLIAVLLVMSILSTSLATMAQATLSTGNSSKIALQAQQYADARASLVKVAGYDNFKDMRKTDISGSDFSEEISDLQEEKDDEDIKTKTAKIKIYYKNENQPRYTLPMILHDADNSSSACQIVTGTNAVSFTADGNYQTVTVIVSSTYTPIDGSWTGTATYNINAAGLKIGSISTQTETYKSGSKGHYWGTTENVVNQTTIKSKINKNNNVSIALASSSRLNSSRITVILS